MDNYSLKEIWALREAQYAYDNMLPEDETEHEEGEENEDQFES